MTEVFANRVAVGELLRVDLLPDLKDGDSY